MAAPRRARHALFVMALLAMVGGATLLAVEFVLRLSGRVTVDSIRTASASTYDVLPGIFSPGQDVIERPHPKLVHHATTNALGFRGPVPASLAKPAGTQRVLCLGDSFTYGSFVDDEATLPAQLHRRFEETGADVEVVNGGVGGTTITDQLVFLEKAWPLEPDLVLLTFSENDVDDLGRHEPLHVSLARNRELKSGLLLGFFYRSFADTALFNLGLRVRSHLTTSSAPAAMAGDSEGKQERARKLRAERWQRYAAELESFRVRVESGDARMAFATYPSDYRIGEDEHTSPVDADRLERVAGIARELGIPVIPLLPALRNSGLGPGDLYLRPWDGHPSPEGYRIASAALHKVLVALLSVQPEPERRSTLNFNRSEKEAN